MKIGVCGGIDRVKVAAECGFDYFEPGFKSLARDSDEKYEAFCSELQKYGISCEIANGFMPEDIKVVGDNIDYCAVKEYLKKGFKRADDLGIKSVVFGSGASRYVPVGFSYKTAVLQIIKFIKEYAAPEADKYGMDVVFEPLCKKETNIINTVKEGSMLASAIDLPNVGCLGDLYHMYVEGDSYDDLRELKGIIRHAHISNPVSKREGMKRCYMVKPDEFDYKGFFDVLKEIGCERVSLEADTRDFAYDAPLAYEVMKMYK